MSRLSLQRLDLPPAPEAATFTLDLDGERVTVRLRRQSLRSPDFRLLVQGAGGTLSEVAPPEPATYRGTIDERPGSIVAGSIRQGRLSAALALADGPTFFVEPLGETASEPHAVYRGDAVPPGSESCASDGVPEAVRPLDPSRVEAELASVKVADVAFDADVEFFQLNHSRVDSTVRDIENVLAAVNAVYQRDCAITHRIVSIIVRTVEPDPYSATAAETLLTQLRNHWNNSQSGVNRDIVHLMTGKTLVGSTIGYANIGAVCNTSRAYGLSRSRYSSNLSKRTALTAHELGHNWNAVHCNKDPYISSPCNIMCSTIAGCDGMGLPNFEPQGQAAILAFAATRACLGTQALAVEGRSAASDIRLETPWPSPIKDHASVRFYVAEAGPVRLEVLDLSGRRVAGLVDGTAGPGWHTATWNARDARRRRIEAGVLFLRLESGVIARTQKLIVVR